MKIYANFSQEVYIEPKEVIKKLIQKEIGSDNWVFEKKGKFYLGYEQSAGCHSFDMEEEITEERYRYIEALELVLKRLG